MSSGSTAVLHNAEGHQAHGRRGRNKWLHWLLSLAILGGLALAAAKYLHGGEVLAALRSFAWGYAAPILLISAFYLVLKAGWFGYALAVLSNMSVTRIMVAYAAGQPATLLPGGIAARAGLLAQAGVPARVSSAPILLNSVLDQVSFVVLALVAALWFEAARTPALIMLAVLGLLCLCLALAPLRRGLSNFIRALLQRFNGAQHWDEFVAALTKVSTPTILGSGVLLTVFAKFLLVVILDLCLAGVGLNAGYPALLLAVALPTIIGRFTPVPAGAGATEAGMIGLLVSSAQLEVNTVTAAVALFRITTVLFHALLGALVYLLLWRGGESAETKAASARA